MKVAVAIAHPAFEREVMDALRRQGKEVVRRCLDDADVLATSSELPIYADAAFHARYPHTILVTSLAQISDMPIVRTHTIGVMGPLGAPGISTIALNYAVALQASVIDLASAPSLAPMTGIREGRWHGAVMKVVREQSLSLTLAAVETTHCVIDLGSSPTSFECDEKVVVVAAHPLSVERYLAHLHDYGSHRLVLNKMEPGPLGQTAHKMLDRTVNDLVVVPRDDRACNEAFASALPLIRVAPKSAIVRAINLLAGIEPRGRRGRVIAVG